MNLAYFRKSKFSKEETIKNLKKLLISNTFEILGETTLPNDNGQILHVCKKEWISKILANDKNVVGLLPCSIYIIENNGEISVGSGNPSIIGGVTNSKAIQALSVDSEITLRQIINQSTGAGEQKVKNIRLYSTTTCPYCIMEKQWLDYNKIAHTVIYVDKDQVEAEKMVRNTGQMGVPVTELEFEDGEIEYVVGFDKAKLSRSLLK